MNENTWKYHSGDKSLMKEKLTQITKWRGQPEDLDFAIIPLEKYGTRWVIKPRKAKDWNYTKKLEYALFRKKIERMV